MDNWKMYFLYPTYPHQFITCTVRWLEIICQPWNIPCSSNNVIEIFFFCVNLTCIEVYVFFIPHALKLLQCLSFIGQFKQCRWRANIILSAVVRKRCLTLERCRLDQLLNWSDCRFPPHKITTYLPYCRHYQEPGSIDCVDEELGVHHLRPCTRAPDKQTCWLQGGWSWRGAMWTLSGTLTHVASCCPGGGVGLQVRCHVWLRDEENKQSFDLNEDGSLALCVFFFFFFFLFEALLISDQRETGAVCLCLVVCVCVCVFTCCRDRWCLCGRRVIKRVSTW